MTGTLGETREKISAPLSGAGVGVAVGRGVGVGAAVSIGGAVGDRVGTPSTGVGGSEVESSPLRSHVAPRMADKANVTATAMMSFGTL
ncbi:MAG: hypothetical protein OXG11_02940 [Chloroflexi bacterium]|nr:hypothetical protein [Chloroflexota bacterium]